MKKIINRPEDVVKQMCHGFVMAHPNLKLDARYKIIYRSDKEFDKVNLISGGGSGHEPAHAGFIGRGMLDAAVCGDVFASPSQIQIYQAIRYMKTNQGVLLIIKNYSGDVMNFKNAAELAREDGILVDYVIVDDDVAVKDSLYTVGRRGVAGTVFVHKIAGAAAHRAKTLPEVKEIAEKVIRNVKSIGFALSSCTVPAKGTPTFNLDENEIEYGVGIHGEPGICRSKLLDADALAEKMVCELCDALELPSQGSDNKVALLVNGFGATPLMELYLLNASVARELVKRKVSVARTFVGNYMTSLDMAGASISLLKLDDELEFLLNVQSEAPAFMVNREEPSIEYYEPYVSTDQSDNPGSGNIVSKTNALIGDALTLENMQYIVDVMCASIIKNEIAFCDLDAYAGDGDFGMSVAKGFRQLRKEWTHISQKANDIGEFLHECSMIIMEYCGGASGPIWGSAFRAAGKAVDGKKGLSVNDFAEMLQAAVLGIQKTGERSFGRGAVVGDKTLIDALVPCADAWTAYSKTGGDFIEAFLIGAKAAVKGAEKTKEFSAKMGRAGTVGERSIGHPDAGAHALGVIFTDIASSISIL